MPRKTGVYPIPWKNDAVMHNKPWTGTVGLEWKPNDIFHANLAFSGFTKTKYSTKAVFNWVGLNKPAGNMFMKEFEKALLDGGMNGKYLRGSFKVVKRSDTYGLQYLGE